MRGVYPTTPIILGTKTKKNRLITKNERGQLDDTTPRIVMERGLHLADPRCLGDEGRLVGVGTERCCH